MSVLVDKFKISVLIIIVYFILTVCLAIYRVVCKHLCNINEIEAETNFTVIFFLLLLTYSQSILSQGVEFGNIFNNSGFYALSTIQKLSKSRNRHY